MHKQRNIKLIIMYDGSRYSGWQRLLVTDNTKTIQGVLEEKLKEILKEDIKTSGSGRTDAGVHAIEQVANFHTFQEFRLEEFKQKLNLLLPEDIKILEVLEVSNSFHSRYDAVGKTYEYRIDMREAASVFDRKYAYHTQLELDLNAMRTAGNYLVGEHDFCSFSSQRKDGKSTVRTIYEISIEEKEKQVKIFIRGNGFLYNMVRIIVGTLVEVGEAKRKPNEIEEILKKRDRKFAGPTISSHGLFLKKVDYN